MIIDTYTVILLIYMLFIHQMVLQRLWRNKTEIEHK